MGYFIMDYQSLADSEKFKKFYKVLCRMSGLTLVLCDESTRFRVPLDYRGEMMGILCSFMRKNPEFNNLCRSCDMKNCEKAVLKRKGISYICHAGLKDIAVPIFINNKHVGTFMGGQLLPDAPDEKNFRRFAEGITRFGFSGQMLRKLYFKTPWMPQDRLDAAVELISIFAEHFSELGSRIIEPETDDRALLRVKAFLHRSMTEDITLMDAAAYAGLSRNYFCHWFHEKTGTPFLVYLKNIRIEKACQLLVSTNKSIAEVAVLSGFQSISAFNRTFSQNLNITPRKYRDREKINR